MQAVAELDLICPFDEQMPQHCTTGDLVAAVAQNPQSEAVLVPMLEIAAHIRRGLRGIARAAEVCHELGIGIHRAHGVEMFGAQPLGAQARGYEGIGEQRQGLSPARITVDANARTSCVPADPSPSLPRQSATACCSARPRHPRTAARCDRRRSPCGRADSRCGAGTVLSLRHCGESVRDHSALHTCETAWTARDTVERSAIARVAQCSYGEPISCMERHGYHRGACSRDGTHVAPYTRSV